jgi:hypothetical protein
MHCPHTLKQDAVTVIDDTTMEVGQPPVSPWAWQPCGRRSLQPLSPGTSVDRWQESAQSEPITSSYLSIEFDGFRGGCSISDKSTNIPLADQLPSVKSTSTGRQFRSQISSQDPARAVRNQISAADWAARRPEITELYRHRGWTLPRVMEEMARRGFHASYGPCSCVYDDD